MADISERAFTVANTFIVILKSIVSISPSNALGSSDNRRLMVFGVIALLTMLAPSTFTVALLTKFLRSELVHILWVSVHLVNFIEGMRFGSLSCVGELLGISGSFRVIMAKVCVLLFKLVLKLKNLVSCISESSSVLVMT